MVKRYFRDEVELDSKTVEIFECPDCGFEHNAIHEVDEQGAWECPLCEVEELKEKNSNQIKIIESQARIIDSMVSDAEEIKKFLLRANECYVNNKDIEVNVNIIKALDILKSIES